MLPDVRHFMDEQALIGEARAAEIIAVEVTARVKVDGSARRHNDAFGLEERPFAIFDPYAVIIDCVTEDGPGQSALCRC